MAASDYVAEILTALGGEDTDFYLAVKGGRVLVQCRYQGCTWGQTCGEIELWEYCADARDHWEKAHA